MKIEGLTIEAIPKPGTDEFDQLAKQFAESAYRHFVELWRQGAEHLIDVLQNKPRLVRGFFMSGDSRRRRSAGP